MNSKIIALVNCQNLQSSSGKLNGGVDKANTKILSAIVNQTIFFYHNQHTESGYI
jgi:hypothetical protein